MEDEQLLDEYILNDIGKIWVGSWGSARGREWVFGQFDACVLKACQSLLERSGIKANSRGDPVQMCRAISRIVSSISFQSFAEVNFKCKFTHKVFLLIKEKKVQKDLD